ncbi:unnamed protein product [Mytilus edulis]|uniref:Uncharacterized protein n=1 Tax=Mytilus edulis TaxID=6550 RepID=A0A8S3SWB3_MYTED|nr:unnamed protein product [Mytilus edulis]
MIVMESTLKLYDPIKQTDNNTTENKCSSDLVTINTNGLAFASVYHRNNGTCVTYYLENLIWYPVRVEMVNHSQAVSFVKSAGHKGFQYGAPSVSTTKRSTTARFVNSFSTYDSTQNTVSSSSLLSSAENNKLSEKISSYVPTTESATPNKE